MQTDLVNTKKLNTLDTDEELSKVCFVFSRSEIILTEFTLMKLILKKWKLFIPRITFTMNIEKNKLRACLDPHPIVIACTSIVLFVIKLLLWICVFFFYMGFDYPNDFPSLLLLGIYLL